MLKNKTVRRDVFSVTGRRYNTAVPWLSLLVAGMSLWRPGFDPKAVHVEFMLDKAALVQVRNQAFRFSPVISIAPMLHTH